MYIDVTEKSRKFGFIEKYIDIFGVFQKIKYAGTTA
jgi:hypothetical protein